MTIQRDTIAIMAVGVTALLAIGLFLFLSPSGGDFGRREVEGPPTVQPEVVAAHAEQFDTEIPEREAGSQQEQAAATYLLGVFQRNGYVVRLESVPVENLVSSTDLLATPPGVDEASTIVVFPYGSPERGSPNGTAIGLVLEVARALNVADPTHTVGFAAVGADFLARDGGALGSRRLAQLLLERDEMPTIVQIGTVAEGLTLEAGGPDAESVFGASGTVVIDPDVFDEAGFTRYVVAGAPDELGSALLQGLERLSR